MPRIAMHVALKQLGLDDTYLMASLYDIPPDIGLWRQAHP